MTTRILIGDVLAGLARLDDDSVQCVVTSPPYWGLRDYGVAGQLGMEPTLAEHIQAMVAVFREVRRVLRPDGTVWLNYGDCYATTPNGRRADEVNAGGKDDRTFRDKPFSTVGPVFVQCPADATPGRNGKEAYRPGHGGRVVAGGFLKPKDLCMVPNRLAIALQDDGWWVRSEIVWSKPNPMPDSVKDRPGIAHEKVFLLTKSARYFYDAEAVREPAAPASVARWSQDVDAQDGSSRANGGSRADRPMKAVGGPMIGGWAKGDGSHSTVDWNKGGSRPVEAAPVNADKQGGHGRRHAGFNERWNDTHKPEKRRGTTARHASLDTNHQTLDDVGRGFGRNLRNVWTIATRPLDVEACGACGTVYVSGEFKRLKRTKVTREDGREVLHRVCRCGRHDAWVSHFATFPPALVEPCIKAGTPEAGSCSSCGAPWVREVKVEHVDRPDCGPDHTRHEDQYADGNRWGQYPDKRRVSSTTGWRPSCKCEDAGTVPALVLDPFGGAGTAAVVADRLQRDAVLIELNPMYADMARARLAADGKMFAQVETEHLDGAAPAAEARP